MFVSLLAVTLGHDGDGLCMSTLLLLPLIVLLLLLLLLDGCCVWWVDMFVSLRAVTLSHDGDGLCTSTLRELKLLSQLRHQHIVRLLEILRDRNYDVATSASYVHPSGTATTGFSEAEMMGWQWHQLDHMQVPHSRQTTMPAPHHSVFKRLDALPAAQPTASKH